MCSIERVNLRAVHSVPHREGYFMSGPWPAHAYSFQKKFLPDYSTVTKSREFGSL